MSSLGLAALFHRTPQIRAHAFGVLLKGKASIANSFCRAESAVLKPYVTHIVRSADQCLSISPLANQTVLTWNYHRLLRSSHRLSIAHCRCGFTTKKRFFWRASKNFTLHRVIYERSDVDVSQEGRPKAKHRRSTLVTHQSHLL